MDRNEYERALKIAERWKHRLPDSFTTTISGAIAEEMGILARALIYAEEQKRACGKMSSGGCS